jgi:hypothetical protein
MAFVVPGNCMLKGNNTRLQTIHVDYTDQHKAFTKVLHKTRRWMQTSVSDLGHFLMLQLEGESINLIIHFLDTTLDFDWSEDEKQQPGTTEQSLLKYAGLLGRFVTSRVSNKRERHRELILELTRDWATISHILNPQYKGASGTS